MIRDSGPGQDFVFCTFDQCTPDLVKRADVIIGKIPPEMLGPDARCRWLQLDTAGADRYMKAGVLPDGCILTNATGAYGLAISEHMTAVLLAMMKNLPSYVDAQRRGVWEDHGTARSVWGSDILVVGTGDIGTAFARRMKAMGAHRVTGVRRTAGEIPDFFDSVTTSEHLLEVLPHTDVVAAALPGTAQTHHMFDCRAFAAMKEGAYFINVGRGGSVDSLALAKALNSGHLAGASCDVTEPEPLDVGHPLWNAKNFLLTPHVSGGRHLPETFERIVGICCKNLESYLNGGELRNVVDPNTGYRKHTGNQ